MGIRHPKICTAISKKKNFAQGKRKRANKLQGMLPLRPCLEIALKGAMNINKARTKHEQNLKTFVIKQEIDKPMPFKQLIINIKHERQCLTTYKNTKKRVENMTRR